MAAATDNIWCLLVILEVEVEEEVEVEVAVQYYNNEWPHPSSAWLWLGESRERRWPQRAVPPPAQNCLQRSSRERGREEGGGREDTNFPILCGGAAAAAHTRKYYHHYTGRLGGRPWLAQARLKTIIKTTITSPIQSNASLAKLPRNGKNCLPVLETRQLRQKQNLDPIGIKPSSEVESQYSQGSVKGGKYSNV